MGSVHNLTATTSLTQKIFQLCGTWGIRPQCAIDQEDFLAVAQAVMPDPMQFNTASDYAKAYQAWSLLRKFDSFPIDIDRQAVASADFDKSEVSCGRVNLTVGALPYVPGIPLGRQQQSSLELARSLIHKALGKFDWEEFQMACDFSAGASTRVPRKRGNTVFKLDGRPHVTVNCRDLAVHFIWCNESWRKYCQDKFGRESDPYSWVQVTPGSRFSTTEKDSLKNRPICLEPELNMFFQKGIGKMLRRRLRRRGIDLTDQTRNQRLALWGSISNLLATIDLSAASDSVALAIVEYLLPKDWYQAMMITRSAYVLKDGKYRKLEKISSMGNGFTFELESLIFWGLASAVCITHDEDTSDVSVYGDDIIVPSAVAPQLIDLLSSLGFETNKNKTFVGGPFRESCGKHYFLGADVTPFKVASQLDNWGELYLFCNNLAEWGWASTSEKDEITACALARIPPRKRCFVPPTFGSKSGLRVPVPPGKPVYSKALGSYRYKFSYLREAVNNHDLNGPVAYLSSVLLREQRTPSIDMLSELPTVPRSHEHGEVVDSEGYDVLRRPDSYSIRCNGWTTAWSDAAA